LFEHLDIAALRGGRLRIRVESQRFLPDAAFDGFLEANERASANEENVGRIHRSKFLVRVLASALGRHIRDRAFENFQQGLLQHLRRNISGDGRVLILL